MKKQNTNIPEYQIWDLKNAISEFIEPRLKAYIKKVDDNELVSIPTWVENKPDIDEQVLRKTWSSILKDMLFPFDFQINPDNYISLADEEILLRKEKGLQLFANYFEHLWD